VCDLLSSILSLVARLGLVVKDFYWGIIELLFTVLFGLFCGTLWVKENLGEKFFRLFIIILQTLLKDKASLWWVLANYTKK
jgi:hypothetical protein